MHLYDTTYSRFALSSVSRQRTLSIQISARISIYMIILYLLEVSILIVCIFYVTENIIIQTMCASCSVCVNANACPRICVCVCVSDGFGPVKFTCKIYLTDDWCSHENITSISVHVPPMNNNMNMQDSLDTASACSGLDGVTCQLALLPSCWTMDQWVFANSDYLYIICISS
jgi:hypothetical protein